MSEAALGDLAHEAGVLTHWEDATGEARTVPPETLRAVLAAMDLPAASAGDIADSRERLARRGAGLDFFTADAGRAFTLPSGERQVIEDPGYHRLEDGGKEVTVAVAPARAIGVERRMWGAAVQLYSLRGERPAPFGDFGHLAEFARAAASRGADAVAISPVHALFAADPDRYSPYGPSTRLFLNPAYADPAAVLGEALEEDEGADLVDWKAALPRRFGALRGLFDRFQAQGPLRDDFEAFRGAGGDDLEGHARFEALHARFGPAGWQGWPEPYRDRTSPQVAAFARQNAAEVEFHVFAQWLADRSLAAAHRAARNAGMALGLITDVAVGMDPGGSHAWSRPGDLLTGLSIGAPPDAFQAKGQDWGLTAFSPQALARTGYDGFISTLRAAMRHAGGVRIDHAMGVRRLWLLPSGASPTQGAYLTYPQDDLLRLIALESWRARAVVVGEDLGTVPKGFRQALDGRGVMGMRVLPFERTKDGGFIAPDRWSQDSAALTTTHDLAPIALLWRQASPGDRARLWKACRAAGCASGAEPAPDQPARAVDAAVAFVGAAASRLAIIQAEDLFGLEAQPNVPGTIDEHPNWRRRLPGRPEALFEQNAARVRALDARRRP